MNDPLPPTTETASDGESAKTVAIYVIYLVALFTGVPFFIGVVLAYFFRGSAPAWAQSHYDHQIGIFWRVLIGGVAISIFAWIAMVLTFIVIGIFLWPIVAILFVYLWIWTLVRCVRGFQSANRAAPYGGPVGWRI